MTRLKKVLSVVLCLSMLLGTLTAGLLFASADDTQSAAIPTYQELADKAAAEGRTDFFYCGYEITENGEPTDYVLPVGGTFHVKFYVKTNKDLYHGKYYFALSDLSFFNTGGAKIMPTDGRVNGLSTNWTPTKKTSTNSKFVTGTGNNAVSNISGYTPSEIGNWVIFEINDKLKSVKDTSTDSPICEFDIVLDPANTTANPKSTGTFDFMLFADAFTAASGEKKTEGQQFIGGTANSNLIAVDGFELQSNQTFTVAYEVSFYNADGSLIENQYPAKNEKIVPPEVENLYSWADKDGNFVDLSNVYMGDESLEYTAVLNDTQVEVTLDGNGGLVDGEESKVISAPISEALDLKPYTASKDGDTFKGWSVNGIVTDSYTFGSAKPVTASAVWADSATLKVLIGKSSGEWVDYIDYVGVPGETLTQETYDAINSAVAAEFKKSGKSAIECEEEPVYNGLKYIAGVDSEAGGYAESIDKYAFENIIFGETPFLLISANFVQTVNFYYPNTNEDGSIIENSWNKYNTLTYTFASQLNGKNYDEAEPGNIDNISCAYKLGGVSDYDPAKVGTGVVSVNTLQTFEDDDELKYIYTSVFKDGKGNELTPSGNNISLFTSGYTVPGVFDFYTTPKGRTVKFAFNAIAGGSVNFQIIDKDFAVGDTLTADDLASCYISTNKNVTYDANDLFDDCTVIERPGYKLVDIWYGEESSDETSIFKGNTVTLTKEMMENEITSLPSGGKYFDAIVLDSSFEEKSFEFTVMYQKADGTWDELTTKSFSGKQAVTYSDLVDADLEKVINDNLPTGEILSSGSFIVESTGAVKSSFYAYDGPITLKIQYTSDQRSAFIDFNNGKDGADVGFRKGDFTYGTVIYNPDYDPDAKDEDGKSIAAPFFNNFLEGGDSNIPSVTVKTQKKDSKGNLLYEPLYQDVKDEDGNVVIDPITKEPKQEMVYEEVKDENGNVKLDDDGNPVMQVVYDTSKPIYDDPKGNSIYRPYRACEYMGTKVYHVDQPIRNWSDMPAESEWKDGYENGEYRLYNTTIMQLQWKSDEDFFFRVYDTANFFMGLPIIGDGFSLNMNGNIYSALGKDFKWYYWKNNRPCQKGEGALNSNPENQIILLLWPKKEVLELGTDENGNPITSEGWYLSALPLAKTCFKPSFIPDLIPTLLPLIKGLLN